MGLSDPDCVALLQWAAPRLGLRWAGFRNVRGQVCKRIARRMAALGLDAAAYRALLERSPAEWPALDAACRVTISRFYRDRAVWDALADRLRASEASTLRCWSAGCASGEEPYTLAIVLREVVRPRAFEILATDLDPVVLERARTGCYPPGTLAELPRAWLASAFERRGELFCVREALRAGIQWSRQDVRQELPPGPFELILCRNLAFTYLAPELEREVGSKLVERLASGGLLVIGGHEELPEELVGLSRQGKLPIFARVENEHRSG